MGKRGREKEEKSAEGLLEKCGGGQCGPGGVGEVGREAAEARLMALWSWRKSLFLVHVLGARRRGVSPFSCLIHRVEVWYRCPRGGEGGTREGFHSFLVFFGAIVSFFFFFLSVFPSLYLALAFSLSLYTLGLAPTQSLFLLLALSSSPFFSSLVPPSGGGGGE